MSVSSRRARHIGLTFQLELCLPAVLRLDNALLGDLRIFDGGFDFHGQVHFQQLEADEVTVYASLQCSSNGIGHRLAHGRAVSEKFHDFVVRHHVTHDRTRELL